MLRCALRATAITLPFEITVERRASTHDRGEEIWAATDIADRASRVANLARAVR